MPYFPERIICLTEETTETLYLLGEQDRIVGISGFTVRPPQARKEKPKVSTFLDAKTDEILALQPDLVIGFSDIQAKIAQELISQGVTVWVNNYRSVHGVLSMIVQLGALVGQQEKALDMVADIENTIQAVKEEVAHWPVRPKVYFEEWFDPLITGIQWVTELVEIAGGVDVFPEHSKASLAKDRIIQNPQEVVERNPDMILASWCGKMVKKDKIKQRDGWSAIRAVQDDGIHEIKSAIILQPGPAAVTDGLVIIHSLMSDWVAEQG